MRSSNNNFCICSLKKKSCISTDWIFSHCSAKRQPGTGPGLLCTFLARFDALFCYSGSKLLPAVYFGAAWPLHPWKAGDLSPEKAKSFILGKSWYIRGSLLQSDHELSSIINQRAPERPSLGRGQLET